MDRVERDALRAWTPVRINIGRAEPSIDWAVVDGPLLAPFFEQSAHEAMEHPFNAVFGRRTPLDVLDALAQDEPPVAPAGLIFHMSRCGSTLVAQMLSRLTGVVVLSEPQPVDALLRLRPRIGDAALIARLRALIAALGGPQGPGGRIFVKLHAWHVLALPLFLAAFPQVPWVFVFREPRAVLRSQARRPGAEVVAGTIDPAYAALDAAAAFTMPPGDYAARLVAAFCEAALRAAAPGRSAFLAYDTLAETMLTRLLPFFGLRADREDEALMLQIAAFDTKAAGAAFNQADDPDWGRAIEERAAALLDAPYAAMRALALR